MTAPVVSNRDAASMNVPAEPATVNDSLTPSEAANVPFLRQIFASTPISPSASPSAGVVEPCVVIVIDGAASVAAWNVD